MQYSATAPAGPRYSHTEPQHSHILHMHLFLVFVEHSHVNVEEREKTVFRAC